MRTDFTTPTIATARIAAADSQTAINALAARAAAPIDRITLQLAAHFSNTAARHLAEAYTIVRDYDREPLDADTKGDHNHDNNL